MATCLFAHAQEPKSHDLEAIKGQQLKINWCLCRISSLRYQQVLDKYYNDQTQWEEKAREELTARHIQTGADPATQLTKASTPASLKEDMEVQHPLVAFYAEMVLWKLGV